ncbi:MAG: hypothetical protein ACI915_002262 [Gammaproteobacteria bacterium]|jgi:hypothetical protein
MERLNKTYRLFGLSVIAASMVGCASNQPADNSAINAARAQYEQRITQKDSEISALQASLADVKSSMTSAAPVPVAMASMDGDSLLPPNAKSGECYAHVLVPPKYEMTSEQVLKSAASTRIETIPASYEMGTV